MDETVVRCTDHRTKGWLPRMKRHLTTLNCRLSTINVFAVISNRDEFFFTVNQGKTNCYTLAHFFIKLIQHLGNIDKGWRQHTILMVDNAPYHRGAIMQRVFEKLDLPIMYLGPYHFKMAPIEMMFAYIKSHDLNPLRTKINTA